MNILVIEASTSSAKAMLHRDGADTHTVHQIKYPGHISDVKTQDIAGIIETVFACAKELIDRTNATVDIIATASVWHSYILLDGTGEPITPVKTWADTQASETVREYRRNRSVRERFYQKTGCNIHSKYPCWKWMHDRQMLPVGAKVRVGSVPEYLFEKLTGERAISKNAASGTGFFNIHTLAWDKEVLNFCGIAEDQLSVLKEYDYCGKLCKAAADALGLKEGIPVIIPGADGALNQIGEGALRGGIMTMSVGTSSAIRLSSDVPMLPREPATWCYYVGDGIRLVGAATAAGGNCVDWFVKGILRNAISFPALEEALEKIDKMRAPIFLPFLYGEQSPGWDDSRLGAYCDLSGENDVFDMYYGILEGVLFNLYHCYTFLSRLMEGPGEIRLSGGIVNSDYWVQMAADIFHIPIAVSTVEHGSMMGSLAIAKKVTGRMEKISDYTNEKNRVIQPDEKNGELYEARYVRYKQYYDISPDQEVVR
jgi:gluconokinase